MTRWKAAGLHLVISVLLISTLALAALLVWYPFGTYAISGVKELFTLMLAVDVSIGPLLTCVIYKQGKPSLKRDLAVIGVLQAAFLGYGLQTLWHARPVFLVASDYRYNLVFASDIDPADLAKAAQPRWKTLPITGPLVVGALPPTDPDEKQQLLLATMTTGIDIHQLPKYYVPLEQVAPALLEKGAEDKGGTKQVYITSRFGDANLQIDPVTATPIRIVKD